MITEITDEQSEELDRIAERWIKKCLEPIRGDRREAEKALAAAYVEAGLEKPKIFIWVGDPFIGAYTCGALSRPGDPIRDMVMRALTYLEDGSDEKSTNASELDPVANDHDGDPDGQSGLVSVISDSIHQAIGNDSAMVSEEIVCVADDAISESVQMKIGRMILKRIDRDVSTVDRSMFSTYESTHDGVESGIIGKLLADACVESIGKGAIDQHLANQVIAQVMEISGNHSPRLIDEIGGGIFGMPGGSEGASRNLKNAMEVIGSIALPSIGSHISGPAGETARKTDDGIDGVSDQVDDQVHDAVKALSVLVERVASEGREKSFTPSESDIELLGRIQEIQKACSEGVVHEALEPSLFFKVLDVLSVAASERVHESFVNALEATNENPPALQDFTSEEGLDKDRWGSAKGTWYRRLYGQYHSWLSYYDAMEYLGVKECARLRPLMDLAQHAGWCWVWDGVAVMTERHIDIHRDNEDRLHCETGPAIAWPSGWSIYLWHGVRIPSGWIDGDELTPEIALGWENVEQRRCAMEILGWDKVLDELGATVIDEDPDPAIGTLLRVNLPDAPASQFMKVKCGTGRIFVLPVPPESEGITTALQANAWSYGLSPEQYKLMETRT